MPFVPAIPELRKEMVEHYLTRVYGKRVSLIAMTPLGGVDEGESIKNYGYGKPLRLDFQVEGQGVSSAVFHIMAPNPFGHEFMADRAQVMLWAHQAFNHLPLHARSLDVGALTASGELISVGDAEEFWQLTEYAEGEGYFLDLERLRDTHVATSLDFARMDSLCNYLVEIHRVPGPDPALYARRIRELVGHGECIMGLTDSYPPHPMIPRSLLEEIEHRCVSWRWKINRRTHRLRQVHGDFHPWNILFQPDTKLRVLDRSRGEWGEPADDVTCLTINYLFFALQANGRVDGVLGDLFSRFWEHYLTATGDREILEVAAPFFAFRGLVLANPVWYPHLSDDIRAKLFRFVKAVLDSEVFHPAEVNAYCGC